MRIDKFLKNSRIIKRRTVAKLACEGKRITINGKVCKPSDNVKTGDVLNIQFGENIIKVRVEELIENPRKDDSSKMFSTL